MQTDFCQDDVGFLSVDALRKCKNRLPIILYLVLKKDRGRLANE